MKTTGPLQALSGAQTAAGAQSAQVLSTFRFRGPKYSIYFMFTWTQANNKLLQPQTPLTRFFFLSLNVLCPSVLFCSCCCTFFFSSLLIYFFLPISLEDLVLWNLTTIRLSVPSTEGTWETSYGIQYVHWGMGSRSIWPERPRGLSGVTQYLTPLVPRWAPSFRPMAVGPYCSPLSSLYKMAASLSLPHSLCKCVRVEILWAAVLSAPCPETTCCGTAAFYNKKQILVLCDSSLKDRDKKRQKDVSFAFQ